MGQVDDVLWGELRLAVAAGRWADAWSEAEEGEDDELSRSESYILAHARRAGELGLAVRAWLLTYGVIGYGRIQRLAGWHDVGVPDVTAQGLVDGLKRVAAVHEAAQRTSSAMDRLTEQMRQTRQAMEAFGAAIAGRNPYPHGPVQRHKRSR